MKRTRLNPYSKKRRALRPTIGHLLRNAADRIDYDGSVGFTGLHLRFVEGEGAVVSWNPPGCKLWIFRDDYDDNAWAESDAPSMKVTGGPGRD